MRKLHTFFTTKAATGMGTSCPVTLYDKIIFAFDVDTNSTLTVKFQGSVSDTPPDFTAAQSASNQWDYIEVVDLQDGSAIDGDTGVSVAAGQDHRQFQANVDGLVHVNAIITAFVGGSATVKGALFNHNIAQ